LKERRERRIKNQKHVNAIARQWSAQNRDKTRENFKRWWYKQSLFDKYKKGRKWREEHPEYAKVWDALNKDKRKVYNKTTRIKRESTLKGRLNMNLSRNIRQTLTKGSKANRHWESLVGYTIAQLEKHLEKLFKPGMTWANYGKIWEIDHKIPIVVFNFNKPEHIDFRLCWSLKNLQPLGIKENRSKGAKLEKPFQPSLKINLPQGGAEQMARSQTMQPGAM